MTAGAKGLDALWCKIRIQSEMNDGGKMIGWREQEKQSGAQATTAATNVPAGPEKKYGRGDHELVRKPEKMEPKNKS